MPNQTDTDAVYMGTAILHSQLSRAKRKKVGAVLVTESGVTLTGYNGTPSGWDNNCEEEYQDLQYVPLQNGGYYLPVIAKRTKREVIHAELNCILKAAKEGVSVVDSTVYVTLSPCVPCAAMLAQVGIKELVYKDVYRDTEGIDLLQSHGIVVRSV